MGCSLPGSSLHGRSQARMEGVAFSLCRGSSRPKDWIRVSYICRWMLYHWASREALTKEYLVIIYIYIHVCVCVCVHKHLKCNELIMQYTHLYSNSSLFLCHELTKTINIFRTLYLLCLLPGVPLHLIRPYCASLPSFKSLLKDCLLRGDFFDYSI